MTYFRLTSGDIMRLWRKLRLKSRKIYRLQNLYPSKTPKPLKIKEFRAYLIRPKHYHIKVLYITTIIILFLHLIVFPLLKHYYKILFIMVESSRSSCSKIILKSSFKSSSTLENVKVGAIIILYNDGFS